MKENEIVVLAAEAHFLMDFFRLLIQKSFHKMAQIVLSEQELDNKSWRDS